MDTTFTVYKADGTTSTSSADMEEKPGYKAIDALVRPLIGSLITIHDHLEHVSVLHNGGRADMFVDEEGVRKRLPRNEAATTIYRNNWMTLYPDTDPETLPFIYGDAVLIGRRIWF